MIIEILLFSLVLWLILETYRMHELKKHDENLFEFCAVRRDAMKLLRDNYDTLTKKEYIHLYKVIASDSGTIHAYNDYKTILFDFRRFTAFIKATKRMSRNAESLLEKAASDNSKIIAIEERYLIAVLKSFFAFTPFLTTEIILKVFYALASVKLLSKYNGTAQQAKYVVESIRQWKTDLNNHQQQKYC